MRLLIQVANLTQRERDIKLFVVNDTGKRILPKKRLSHKVVTDSSRKA